MGEKKKRSEGEEIVYKQTAKQKEAVHRYYFKHKEHIKKRARERNLEKRKIVFGHYGNKCTCCGESQLEFLTMDHINNDGAKFRKENNIPGGYTTYIWIIKNNFPNDLQILCWNCNVAKMRYGKCPHRSNNE